MKTGGHLKIVSMGTKVLGVRLEGNPKNPEPEHFRVTIPGATVDITRTTDNKYWVHVHVNHSGANSWEPEEQEARIIEARLDINGMHAGQEDIGDFKNPGLYHLAVKVGLVG
jgi:hypothetical protein